MYIDITVRAVPKTDIVENVKKKCDNYFQTTCISSYHIQNTRTLTKYQDKSVGGVAFAKYTLIVYEMQKND